MPDAGAAITLRMAAVLVGYPDKRWRRALGRVARALREDGAMPGAAHLSAFVAAAEREGAERLMEGYVEAFDFATANALYLTAHEHADDRRRGAAMLALKERIEGAGFRVPPGEMPDFYPLLLEFVAVAGEAPVDPIEPRLRALADRLAANLSQAGSPYALLFQAIQAALPVPAAQLGDLPAELGDDDRTMPYPLHYG